MNHQQSPRVTVFHIMVLAEVGLLYVCSFKFHKLTYTEASYNGAGMYPLPIYGQFDWYSTYGELLFLDG